MAAIFLVSHQPSTHIPQFGLLDLLLKKGAHFLAYAVLAWLVQWAWGVKPGSWGWAFLVTVLYASSDEYHQTFVPGRSGSLGDVLIDSSGALSALLFNHWYSQGRRREVSKQRSDKGAPLTVLDSP
jgi:VanZ family protein